MGLGPFPVWRNVHIMQKEEMEEEGPPLNFS